MVSSELILSDRDHLHHMFGNMPLFSMARCNRWPVATSSFMRKVASS